MCDTVLTMSNNQIIELEQLTGNRRTIHLSLITEKEAKVALRLSKGNIWQAVEKCIQRYQDDKAFGVTRKSAGIVDKNAKSFSLKVAGVGAGSANNDANECVSETVSDVAEEDVENVMNPDLILDDHHQTPMEVFLSSKEIKNDLLDYYVDKISTENTGIEKEELEALISSWRYEKTMLEQERDRLVLAEKEKAKMQKLIDLHRRIGGYLSDGTTTEEELDQEVELVFANNDVLRQKLAQIEIDEDQIDNKTPTVFNSSLMNSEIGDEEVDTEFDQVSADYYTIFH